MAHGLITVYTGSIAANAKTSSTYDLKRTYDTVYIQVPSMTAFAITGTCAIYVQGSYNGSTFARLYHPPVNTSSSGLNVFELPTTVSSAVVPIPNGLRYIRIETANTMSAAVDFNVICSDL